MSGAREKYIHVQRPRSKQNFLVSVHYNLSTNLYRELNRGPFIGISKCNNIGHCATQLPNNPKTSGVTQT